MIQYPTELDRNVVTLIVDIISDGDIAERRDEFALAVWNIQGVLQGVVFGDPLSSSIIELEDLTKLKNIMEEVLEDGLPIESNPLAVMEIVKLILTFVNFLLESKS